MFNIKDRINSTVKDICNDQHRKHFPDKSIDLFGSEGIFNYSSNSNAAYYTGNDSQYRQKERNAQNSSGNIEKDTLNSLELDMKRITFDTITENVDDNINEEEDRANNFIVKIEQDLHNPDSSTHQSSKQIYEKFSQNINLSQALFEERMATISSGSKPIAPSGKYPIKLSQRNENIVNVQNETDTWTFELKSNAEHIMKKYKLKMDIEMESNKDGEWQLKKFDVDSELVADYLTGKCVIDNNIDFNKYLKCAEEEAKIRHKIKSLESSMTSANIDEHSAIRAQISVLEKQKEKIITSAKDYLQEDPEIKAARVALSEELPHLNLNNEPFNIDRGFDELVENAPVNILYSALKYSKEYNLLVEKIKKYPKDKDRKGLDFLCKNANEYQEKLQALKNRDNWPKESKNSKNDMKSYLSLSKVKFELARHKNDNNYDKTIFNSSGNSIMENYKIQAVNELSKLNYTDHDRFYDFRNLIKNGSESTLRQVPIYVGWINYYRKQLSSATGKERDTIKDNYLYWQCMLESASKHPKDSHKDHHDYAVRIMAKEKIDINYKKINVYMKIISEKSSSRSSKYIDYLKQRIIYLKKENMKLRSLFNEDRFMKEGFISSAKSRENFDKSIKNSTTLLSILDQMQKNESSKGLEKTIFSSDSDDWQVKERKLALAKSLLNLKFKGDDEVYDFYNLIQNCSVETAHLVPFYIERINHFDNLLSSPLSAEDEVAFKAKSMYWRTMLEISCQNPAASFKEQHNKAVEIISARNEIKIMENNAKIKALQQLRKVYTEDFILQNQIELMARKGISKYADISILNGVDPEYFIGKSHKNIPQEIAKLKRDNENIVRINSSISAHGALNREEINKSFEHQNMERISDLNRQRKKASSFGKGNRENSIFYDQNRDLTDARLKVANSLRTFNLRGSNKTYDFDNFIKNSTIKSCYLALTYVNRSNYYADKLSSSSFHKDRNSAKQQYWSTMLEVACENPQGSFQQHHTSAVSRVRERYNTIISKNMNKINEIEQVKKNNISKFGMKMAKKANKDLDKQIKNLKNENKSIKKERNEFIYRATSGGAVFGSNKTLNMMKKLADIDKQNSSKTSSQSVAGRNSINHQTNPLPFKLGIFGKDLYSNDKELENLVHKYEESDQKGFSNK